MKYTVNKMIENRLPKVSIILVNWMQAALTASCLKSLNQISYPNTEIIVVDNGSCDGSVERLRAEFPEIRIIENGRNLGYTGGNNAGMLAATGNYFLLLNNDTEVAPDFIDPMIHLAESDTEIGAVSPKIVYYDHPDTIQYAGGGKIDLTRGRISWRGWMQKDDGRFGEAVETTLLHGAALLVKRCVVEKVGLLNEHFFAYYEEIDWSLSIRKVGYSIYFMPKSLVLHKESMTVKKDNPLRVFLMNRNRIYLSRIHTGFWQHLFFIHYLLGVSLSINLIRFLSKKRIDLVMAYCKGIIAGFRNRDIQSKKYLKWR